MAAYQDGGLPKAAYLGHSIGSPHFIALSLPFELSRSLCILVPVSLEMIDIILPHDGTNWELTH